MLCLRVLQSGVENSIRFITTGLVLWAIVNALMKFMPEYATQLPPPIYEFFYAITLNREP